MNQLLNEFFNEFKKMAITKIKYSEFFAGELIPDVVCSQVIESWDSMTLVALQSSATKLFLSIHYNVESYTHLVLYHDMFREITNIIAGGLKGLFNQHNLEPLQSTLPGQTFGFLCSFLKLEQEFSDLFRFTLRTHNQNILLSLAFRAEENSDFFRMSHFNNFDMEESIIKF